LGYKELGDHAKVIMYYFLPRLNNNISSAWFTNSKYLNIHAFIDPEKSSVS
jgi:hypothetical protein